MMKSFCSRLAIPFLGLLLALCQSCTKTEQAPASAPGKPAVFEPSTVVAEIGDYVITRKNLEERMAIEFSPDPDEGLSPKPKSTDPKTWLMRMLAEKVMIMEARKQNYLADKRFRESTEGFKKERFASLMVQTCLKDKVIVTDAEIDEKIKAKPELDRQAAGAELRNEKTKQAVEELYNSLCKELDVQKVKDNFPKAVAIYQRLMSTAGKTYGLIWVPQEEKDLVLVTFDGGKVRLEDWFYFLCDLSPPSRPTDLNTIEGFEKILDRAMRRPIFAAGAESRKVDKDGSVSKQIKEREEMYLFQQAMWAKTKDVKEPTEDEVVAYFYDNKDRFMMPDMLKIDQIWLKNRETARIVKADLNGGKSFELVKQEYSADKKSEPVIIYRNSEGEKEFFPELWVGEVNQIVGPARGLYNNRGKWRIVKILEKRQGLTAFPKEMAGDIKAQMCYEQRQEVLAKYREQLLEKYQYKIYDERIKDIKPGNVP